MPVPPEPQPRPEPVSADRSADRAARPAVAETDAAALRDANRIAARVADDESAADAEREHLTREALPVLELPSDTPVLAAEERLHAIRKRALLERGHAELPASGTLLITSQRLLHLADARRTEVPLPAIMDIAVALERLLLVSLADGSDLAIEVDQPRLLRVQLAAVRAAIKERR